MQATRWCFTDNNPTVSLRKTDAMRYLIYGRESSATGTPHHQGFIIMRRMSRLAAMKKLLPSAHWEIAKGTSAQAAAYCKKDGDFTEFGECPDQGGKTCQKRRYEDAFQAAKDGRLDDIDAELRIRYYRTFKQIRADHQQLPADSDNVTGVWIYGPTGVGKSRYARETYPGAYFKRPNKWFDGYNGHPYVIIEDLDPSHKWMAHDIKIWTDRYSFPAETKGGTCVLRPDRVVITSQYAIEQIFDVEDARAIERRCEIINMCI